MGCLSRSGPREVYPEEQPYLDGEGQMKVGDLVRHKSFDDLYGVVTSVKLYQGLVESNRVEVLWSYDPGYGQHTPHHPDRLEVIREGR